MENKIIKNQGGTEMNSDRTIKMIYPDSTTFDNPPDTRRSMLFIDEMNPAGIERKFTPDQELKALSWRQPYGTAMLCGKIETRTWATKYRGWVLICASAKPYNLKDLLMISGDKLLNDLDATIDKIHKRFLGYAFAIGYLYNCRLMKKDDEAKTFVKYDTDLYCHEYSNVKEIVPFEWKGKQGWSKVPDILKYQIMIKTETE